MQYGQIKGVFEAAVGENAPAHSVVFERICAMAEKAGAPYAGGRSETPAGFFAGDSTGLKPANRGDWTDQKWGRRRGFVKLHVADAKTKKIYAKGNHKEGDTPNLGELLRQALSNAKPASPSDGPAPAEPKAKVCLDAAYD